MGDSVECLPEVKIDNICCYPLVIPSYKVIRLVKHDCRTKVLQRFKQTEQSLSLHLQEYLGKKKEGIFPEDIYQRTKPEVTFALICGLNRARK